MVKLRPDLVPTSLLRLFHPRTSRQKFHMQRCFKNFFSTARIIRLRELVSNIPYCAEILERCAYRVFAKIFPY